MEKPSVTASAVINFAEKLEEDSSRFYEELAKKYSQSKAVFLSFSKESKNNRILLTRTYRETITDAIEACFSFEGLSLPDIQVQGFLKRATSYPDALKAAIELESKAAQFYSNILKCSVSLLATISSSFKKVSQKRKDRKLELESMLKSCA
jgi:rubrerythrin